MDRRAIVPARRSGWIWRVRLEFSVVSSEATVILSALSRGDRSQVDRLMELVYGELRGLARRYLGRRETPEPLQPTELVHEAFLKLVDHDTDWRGRSHFYAVAATAMRQVLVDEARKRLRVKRGGGQLHIHLEDDQVLSAHRDEDVLAVHQALSKLETLHPRRGRLVELRFFANMSMDEIAEATGRSRSTVQRDWNVARAWLLRELAGAP